MLAAAALAISPSLSQTSVHLFVFFHGSPDSPSLDAAGRSHEHHELRVADLHPFHPSSSPLHRRSATAVRSRAPPLPLHRFVVPAARRRGLTPPRAPLAKTHTISGSSSPISHHSAVPAWTSCASAASSDSGSHVCPPPLALREGGVSGGCGGPVRDGVRAGGGTRLLATPSARRGLAPRPCHRDGIHVLRPWALLATASAPAAGRVCSRLHPRAPPQRRRPGCFARCLATTCAPCFSRAEATSLVPALEAAPFFPTGATFCLRQRRPVRGRDGVTDLTDRVLHSGNVGAF
ncbi:uncharacterized protein LOC120677519 [Panicum virgatum]|uniref:uncharacterized protein LOC120677519 n=1 Tax=Panicum virgatum TaxID=38727 RepID=UPI0019D5850B|nr:uncharacterized protein LOC120677519 [Panicum virgatum]